MHGKLFGKRHSDGFQHDGPINGVELYNILTDHMNICGPKVAFLLSCFGEVFLCESDALQCLSITISRCDSEVIDQCVKPDVSHVFGVKGQGNPPREAGVRAANAKVFKFFASEKAQHLIFTVLRVNKLWMRFNVINQPLLMNAEFKIVVVFNQLLDLPPHRVKSAIGKAVSFSQKGLFFRRVKSFIGFFIKVPLFVEFIQDGGDNLFMPGFSCPDIVVVSNTKPGDEITPGSGQFIAIFLGEFMLCKSCLLYFLAVFIGACQKKNIGALGTMKSSQSVSENFFISMAQMRMAVYIINRCCQIDTLTHIRFVLCMKSGCFANYERFDF